MHCWNNIKKGNKSNLINAYTPTEDDTKKNVEKTTNFYNKLGSVVKTINNKDCLIIGGDFNARTKMESEEDRKLYNKEVGK